ncbi:MAG: class IV adenylate cyclase [Candidatus Polarisedimenticolia bacterium]
MATTGTKVEVEIKLAFGSVDEALGVLARLPAALEQERRFEHNDVFDTPDGSLARARRLLRLREVGGRGVLTWKEPVAGDPGVKVRKEIESDLGDPQAVREILTRAGFRVVYRYQKYRSDYRWEDVESRQTLAISLDETPIGVYVELEGPKPAIDKAASQMGFGTDRYLLDDYRSLHDRWLRERGLPPSDMTFAGPRDQE